MSDPVYLSSPQIHLFAFQHHYQVDSNSPYILATTAWVQDKYREILDHFYVFQPLRLNPNDLESQTDNLIDPQFSFGNQYQTFVGTVNTNYGLRLIKGKVYARLYRNSYILNLNVAEANGQTINSLAQLSYLNPNNCWISTVDNRDLGQVLLFSAQVQFFSQTNSDLLKFAQRCLATFIGENVDNLAIRSHAQFLHGYLFEFSFARTAMYSQRLLVWLYTEPIESSSLEIISKFIANLLLCSQEIYFSNAQYQSQNSLLLRDWQLKLNLFAQPDNNLNKLTQLNPTGENSLSQYKQKIELIQNLTLAYYRVIQNFKQSIQRVKENRREYDYQLGLFHQTLPQANLNFWQNLAQTHQTIEQKNQLDLEDIQQEYNLLNQGVESVKTAVKTEQTLATRKLQKTIIILAISIGIGLICQNIQLIVALDYNNWNMLSNSVIFGALAALIVYGIIYLQQN